MVVAISGLGFSNCFPPPLPPEAAVLLPLVWLVAVAATVVGPLGTAACCFRPLTGAVHGREFT